MGRATSEPSLLKLVRAHRSKAKCYATHVAFSPDGTYVGIARSSTSSQSPNTLATLALVWDLRSWREAAVVEGCTESVEGLAFWRDGALLACTGSTQLRFMGGEVTVWSTKDWKCRLRIEDEDLESMRRGALSPDGKMIVSGSACTNSVGTSDKLYLWDAASGKLLRKFGKFKSDIDSLQFSPDGKGLAVGVVDEPVASIWDIPSGRKKWQKRAHAQVHRLPVVFSPDGSLLATCGDKNVAVWDARTGKSRGIFKGHQANVDSIAFSKDGALLFSTSWQECRAWGVASGRLIAAQSLPNLNVVGMALSDNDRLLHAVHSINDTVQIMQFEVTLPSVKVEADAPKTSPVSPQALSALEIKLKTAVVTDPDDDAPRLKYAEWLDAHSDPRGEFIRVQCALAKLAGSDTLNARQKTERQRLVKREQALLKDGFAAWTAPLAGLQLQSGQATFRRGFLAELNLSEIGVSDKSLQLLKHVPELEKLDLTGSAVTDKGIPHLREVANLRSLIVDDTKVTPRAMRHLVGLNRLTRATNHLWGNRRIDALENWKQARNDRFRRLPKARQRDEALRALKLITGYLPADKQGKYTTISLSQSWASDADLAYLPAVPEIESLDLFECRAVTSAGLQHLRPLKRLRILRLTETGVTDLEALRHLPALEELNLDSLESLDASSFRHLSALKHLKVLTLRFCRLDDAILEHIAKCGELRELEMIYNDFTEAGLRQLLRLKKLMRLDFDYKESDFRAVHAEIVGKSKNRRKG